MFIHLVLLAKGSSKFFSQFLSSLRRLRAFGCLVPRDHCWPSVVCVALWHFDSLFSHQARRSLFSRSCRQNAKAPGNEAALLAPLAQSPQALCYVVRAGLPRVNQLNEVSADTKYKRSIQLGQTVPCARPIDVPLHSADSFWVSVEWAA